MRGGEFRGGEGYSRKHILVSVDDVLRNFDVEKRRVLGQRTLVFIFIAMRGNQVGTVRRTVDRDLALLAAADGADFLAFRWTKSFGFSFFTNRTGHSSSRRQESKPAEYSADG